LAACSTRTTSNATIAALAAADGDDTTRPQIERATRTLADCKQRLARYRAALEAGTDPAVIAQWSAETIP
jgi:site-specific DNA recombinase